MLYYNLIAADRPALTRADPWSFVSWRFLYVVLLVLGYALHFAPYVGGREPIKIAFEHRVANRDDHGVCWWASAEMVGRRYGIKPLVGLSERVAKTGVGFYKGAHPDDIAHWSKTLGFKVQRNPHGKTPDGINWMMNYLNSGVPVITSIYQTPGVHAVLLTHITPVKVDWEWAPGKTVHDYMVTYVDCNDAVNDTQINWDWFYQHWIGRAEVIDPREHGLGLSPPPVSAFKDQPLVQTPVPPVLVPQPPPNRLMVAQQPFRVAVDKPPYYPHELPYHTAYPQQDSIIILPSNQDINDGVHRPDDMVRYGCYYQFTPEFLKKLAKEQEYDHEQRVPTYRPRTNDRPPDRSREPYR